MNCKKILAALAGFAGAMLFATSANAQVTTTVVGVGSSAQFPTAGIAAVSPDPINAAFGNVCGTHLWTGKNNSKGATVTGTDPRSGTTAEPGSIWVAWDTAQTTACAYLSVDSIVGLRLFFAQGTTSGNGTLNFVSGTAASNLITGFTDTDATVPTAIVSAINGAHFVFAATDVRPEDGQYEFFRVANATSGGGFNYNASCAVAGTPIWSSFSATNAQVDCFSISNVDPISHTAIPTYKTIPLGAAPILIFYRRTGAGLSTGSPTNINSKTATKFFSGQLLSTQAVFGSGVGNAIFSEVQREPLSGTYSTFEFQLVHARDGDSGDTQELTTGGGTISPTPAQCFVPPAAFSACTNPMYINLGAQKRYRAVGTGEMIKAVNGTNSTGSPAVAYNTTDSDAMGYAFYSLGSFFIPAATSANNLKYLTLQGVDGLYGNYDTAGLFGTCSGSINNSPSTNFQCTTKLPSFAHIVDGSYRVWSSYRWAVNTSAPLPPSQVATLIEASQDQAAYALNNPSLGGISAANTNISAIADFVPTHYYPSGTETNYFNYFRSHYPISGVGADNGTAAAFCASDQPGGSPCGQEEGGDMAGVAFQITSDVNYFNTSGGSELLTQIE